MRCQAKNRKGKQCGKSAISGKRVCRLHGGLTPGGTDSPHFKHGRYSKYLPAGIMEKYHEAQSDADLLALRDEIAVMDARSKELFEQLPKGGGAENWMLVSKALQDFLAKRNTKDENKALLALETIVDAGAGVMMLWQEISTTMETRRKLASTEARRLIDMQQMITAEKAMALTYALLDIIRRRLMAYKQANKAVDDMLLSEIATDIRALVAIPAPAQSHEIID